MQGEATTMVTKQRQQGREETEKKRSGSERDGKPLLRMVSKCIVSLVISLLLILFLHQQSVNYIFFICFNICILR